MGFKFEKINSVAVQLKKENDELREELKKKTRKPRKTKAESSK